MSAGYTPGPWATSEDPFDGQDYETIVVLPGAKGGFGTQIARCEHNWNEAAFDERRISWKEAEANARLIAAAPELFEALEFLANVARMTPGLSPMALKQADAALTKARGAA